MKYGRRGRIMQREKNSALSKHRRAHGDLSPIACCFGTRKEMKIDKDKYISQCIKYEKRKLFTADDVVDIITIKYLPEHRLDK